MFRPLTLLSMMLLLGALACENTGSGTPIDEFANSEGPTVGTPTPDLPDFLDELEPEDITLSVSAEQPERTGVGPQTEQVGTAETLSGGDEPNWQVTDTRIAAAAGSVEGGAQLWILNLDGDAEPIEGIANPDGSFETRIEVLDGDRIRIHARTAQSHSPALDLLARIPEDDPTSATFGIAPDETLDCLIIEPANELRIASMDAFTLRNECSSTLSLTTRLRLGDTGFALAATRDSIGAGESTAIELSFDGDRTRERGDVLLLSAESEDATGRYAPGMWSTANADDP